MLSEKSNMFIRLLILAALVGVIFYLNEINTNIIRLKQAFELPESELPVWENQTPDTTGE